MERFEKLDALLDEVQEIKGRKLNSGKLAIQETINDAYDIGELAEYQWRYLVNKLERAFS